MGGDGDEILLFSFYPFTLRAAKRGLTNSEIFYLQMHFIENI